jgi:putative membrane protein insertion efficiency factor
MNVAQQVLVFLGRVYRRAISPVLTAVFVPLGFGCRFSPTCSEYAMEAVRVHGAIKGCGLALGRICRCQPWGGSGPDPVPEPKERLTPTALPAGTPTREVVQPVSINTAPHGS